MECGHDDGAVMGTCAICGESVCSDCFQPLFSVMICSNHDDLEDEGEWEVIGFFSSESVLEDRQYLLNDQGVTCIAVETEDDTVELYVPVVERDDAHAALADATDETLHCPNCKVYYSQEISVCPQCGVSAAESDSGE